MSMFEYKAVNADGSVVAGRLDASSRQDVFKQLDGRGLRPLNIQEAAGRTPKARFSLASLFGRNRVSHAAVHDFTHMLANLLSAGVPLSRALQLLCREAAAPAAQKEWKSIHSLVVDGWSLADAMAQLPKTFNGIYVAMVRAGELGGFLDVVLEQITEFQARERELRSRVTSALVYPAVLVMLAIGVLAFLLVFFIPRFKAMFEEFDAGLPLLTRIIVNASGVVQHYGLFVVLGVGAALFFARKWLQTDAGRRARDEWTLRLPVIGPIFARFAMARFCRMLGTLLGSGVSLISALRVSRESLGNQTLVDTLSEAVDRVQKGERLADSLKDCPALFPTSVLEMISVAEETGRLDKEFVRTAAAAEKDLDRQLRTAVSLAEPLILFVIAGFIGTIFIGMVLPIFTLQDYIK